MEIKNYRIAERNGEFYPQKLYETKRFLQKPKFKWRDIYSDGCAHYTHKHHTGLRPPMRPPFYFDTLKDAEVFIRERHLPRAEKPVIYHSVVLPLKQ